MPPLPPVTKARVAVLFIVQPFVSVEYHCRTAAQEPLSLGAHYKLIQRGAPIAGYERGLADQIGLYIIEPQNVQTNISQTGEKASGRPSLAGDGTTGDGTTGDSATGERADNTAGYSTAAEGTVHRHGLRRVFYSAGYP
jgi:hypothetical protein